MRKDELTQDEHEVLFFMLLNHGREINVVQTNIADVKRTLWGTVKPTHLTTKGYMEWIASSRSIRITDKGMNYIKEKTNEQ